MMGDALPPKTIVSVKANEMMNITITKTFLQLTNKLLMVIKQLILRYSGNFFQFIGV